MKNIILLVVSLLIISNFVHANEEDVFSKVEELNKASMESFGVSLGAVSYLSQITSNSYIPLDYLEQSGNIKLINELELKGYISKYQSKGLPDGRQSEETFIRLKPTKLGFNLILNIQYHSKTL